MVGSLFIVLIGTCLVAWISTSTSAGQPYLFDLTIREKLAQLQEFRSSRPWLSLLSSHVRWKYVAGQDVLLFIHAVHRINLFLFLLFTWTFEIEILLCLEIRRITYGYLLFISTDKTNNNQLTRNSICIWYANKSETLSSLCINHWNYHTMCECFSTCAWVLPLHIGSLIWQQNARVVMAV